jgi:hypothetical protein
MALKLTAYNIVLIEELICKFLTSVLALDNFGFLEFCDS